MSLNHQQKKNPPHKNSSSLAINPLKQTKKIFFTVGGWQAEDSYERQQVALFIALSTQRSAIKKKEHEIVWQLNWIGASRGEQSVQQVRVNNSQTSN